jgi:putative oxidoreductase
MFEKFTEKARRALFEARSEASQRGSPVIGTEHVLLGLLRVHGDTSGELFTRANVLAERLQAAIDQRNPRRQQPSLSVEIPFSDKTKQALTLAESESLRLNHAHIGVEHLLQGLFLLQESTAGRMLAEHGMQSFEVREDAAKELHPVVAPYGRPTTPNPRRGSRSRVESEDVMTAFLGRYTHHTYALMRIVAGTLFLCHGSQKLFGFPPLPQNPPPFIMFGAGSIEFFGGLLIALGLFTGWAAFVSSGEMAAAYWIAHGTKAALPLVNGGELAALYCFLFLFIAVHGAGIFSLDAAWAAARARSR